MSTLAFITTSASNMCRHLSNVIRTAIANSPITRMFRSVTYTVYALRSEKMKKKTECLLFYSESFTMPLCRRVALLLHKVHKNK